MFQPTYKDRIVHMIEAKSRKISFCKQKKKIK